jgi:hypothetical protein
MRNSTRLLTLSLALTLVACSESTTLATDRPQFDIGFMGGGGRTSGDAPPRDCGRKRIYGRWWKIRHHDCQPPVGQSASAYPL